MDILSGRINEQPKPIGLFKHIIILDSDQGLEGPIELTKDTESLLILKIDDIFWKHEQKEVINSHSAHIIMEFAINGRSQQLLVEYTNEQVGLAIVHCLNYLFNSVRAPEAGYNHKVFQTLYEMAKFKNTFKKKGA